MATGFYEEAFNLYSQEGGMHDNQVNIAPPESPTAFVIYPQYLYNSQCESNLVNLGRLSHKCCRSWWTVAE